MNQEEQPKTITSDILFSIKDRQIKIIPKWHFVLKAALFICVLIVLLIVLFALVSLIFFALRQSGAWFGPTFGFNGWLVLFMSMPWLLISLLALLLLALELLLRQYSFAYRRPLIYSLLIVVLFVLLGGLLVERTHLHNNLLKQAEKNELLLINGFYRDLGRGQPNKIHRGQVANLLPVGFMMLNRRSEKIKVIVDGKTQLIISQPLIVGDEVIVFGPKRDNFIKAFGIKRILFDD